HPLIIRLDPRGTHRRGWPAVVRADFEAVLDVLQRAGHDATTVEQCGSGQASGPESSQQARTARAEGIAPGAASSAHRLLHPCQYQPDLRPERFTQSLISAKPVGWL